MRGAQNRVVTCILEGEGDGELRSGFGTLLNGHGGCGACDVRM